MLSTPTLRDEPTVDELCHNHPLAFIYERLGLVFAQIPKNACSSIRQALGKSLGWQMPGDVAEIHRVAVPMCYPWPPEFKPAGFSFAVVRNPWDRLQSFYRSYYGPRRYVDCEYFFRLSNGAAPFRNTMTFAEVVQLICSIPDHLANRHFRSQHLTVCYSQGPKADSPAVDQLLWFDKLAEGWNRLRKYASHPLADLPKINNTARGEVEVEYTDELRDLVADRYRRDIRLFGYRFGEPSSKFQLAHRQDLIRWLPAGGIVAEIGVHLGDFSQEILRHSNPQRLYLLDSWHNRKRETGDWDASGNYDLVQHKFRNDSRVKVRKIFSAEAAGQFPDRYFDWIYIDACHKFRHVIEDLTLWWPKIKPGGYITGHDWIEEDCSVVRPDIEVRQAVQQFLQQHNLQLAALTADGVCKSWAIRKPETNS